MGNELDKAKLEIASYWKDKYEKTQKALDVAADALEWIDETYELGMGYEAAIREKCQNALKQIKEQL